MSKYDFHKTEKKWQKIWSEKRIYTAKDKSRKEKKYILIEFPYPSGEGLHMGHLRPYVAGDVYSRFLRMKGYEVMYPIGWDAFGLPAENFAIKKGVHPSVSTARNIKNAKTQIQSWGVGFDWSREINTTNPDYYKWTQWIFLQFFKSGLAYEANGLINWCPRDKTGLANEEVINGRCERCGAVVRKKEMRQWYLRITAYAEKLLNGLKNLNWPEQIKIQQKNWIGRSEGALIRFPIVSQTNADFTQNDAEIRSYIMGVDDILTDLKKIGVQIMGKSGNDFKVTIPKQSLIKYEKVISKKLKPGFWNEYVGSEVVFIFKDRKGDVFRYIWTEDNEKILLDLCNQYAKPKETFKSIKSMLVGNSWYKGLRESALSSRKSATSTWVEVFTTRPDTIFGATYLVLSPEHQFVVSLLKITSNKSQIAKHNEVKKYCDKTKNRTEEERTENKVKTGVELVGVKAINPATKKEIPVWVADYVLAGYGTGAIMAVPAHDERDYEFAKKFGLPGGIVICPNYPKSTCPVFTGAYTGEGHLVASGKFNGMRSQDARPAITDVFGARKVQYHLRDWVFSRQRYWGEPIPLIHCPKCGIQPVPESDLPVKLPPVKKYEPTGTGESPLAAIKSWVNVKCPKCNGSAKRETNTMPQWAGSSWYYLRYPDPKNKKKFASLDLLKRWLPVDVYFGGMEHTTLHLLYSRFWHLFLYDKKLVSTIEPYARRVPHGIILGPDGEKMSKSRGNVVNPDEMVKNFGADALRMYEMFLGPHGATVGWNEKGILGASRFLERIWKVFAGKPSVKSDNVVVASLHRATKKVGDDIQNFRFNTAISALMICLNDIHDKPVARRERQDFLKILAPFAPHITEEIWQNILGHKDSIHKADWPKYDAKFIKDDTFTLVIQVNGKVRASAEAQSGVSQKSAEKIALDNEKVKSLLKGVMPKKVIYVPGRLINLVI